MIILLELGLLALLCNPVSSSYRAWHLTDVHIDPYYVKGSIPVGCYCETFQSCPRMGSSCTMAPDEGAGYFGNSEGDCATPTSLWHQAIDFISQKEVHSNQQPIVFFTGDFIEAGASYACSDEKDATTQVLDIITEAWNDLRKTIPGVKIFGCFGNHDTAPGDQFGAGKEMKWLYENVSSLWAPDVGQEALVDLKRGGYYATRPLPGLTVIALNTNLWATINKMMKQGKQEGIYQFQWLQNQLKIAHQNTDNIIILGHIPPYRSNWLPGYYEKFVNIIAPFKTLIQAQLYGHVHHDEFMLTRVPASEGHFEWKETTGIKWCSGGGNVEVGDIWGYGIDGLCPYPPFNMSDNEKVSLCEALCNASNATGDACAGFTYYPASESTKHTECCFRDTTSNKPIDPTSKARCYEKVYQYEEAVGVILIGPSLTEGYPATNPVIRSLQFENNTHSLLDIITYYADLHQANKKGDMVFDVEYDMRTYWNMTDLSIASFELLVAKFANDENTWQDYKGAGNSSLFYKRYIGEGSQSCHPVPTCNGDCKTKTIELLNGTNLRIKPGRCS